MSFFATCYAVLAAWSCLGDPTGPAGLRLVPSLPDTAWIGGPGEALPHPVAVRVEDAHGKPIAGVSLSWRVRGHGALVVEASPWTDENGEGQATWVLGTNAAEQQILTVNAQSISAQGQLVLQGHPQPHIVARLFPSIDTLTPIRLGDSVAFQINAVDPYGNVFPAPNASVAVRDTGIVTLTSQELLAGPRRGRTTIHAVSQGVADSFSIHVTQYVARIVPAEDTVKISSLGGSAPIAYAVWDDRNRIVKDTAVTLSVADTNVVRSTDSVSVVSGNDGSLSLVAVSSGLALVTLSVPGVSTSVSIVVAQMPAALRVTAPPSIVTLPVGGPVPLTCTVLDANGYVIADATVQSSVSVASQHGTVSGNRCDAVQVVHSGIDTLSLTLGGLAQAVPIVVAAAPIVSAPLGAIAVADTFPGQPGYTWAPSAHLNPSGTLEVYYSVYSAVADSSGYTRADLHRLVWLGGNQFHYDGIVLTHDDNICSPQGQGIENTAIVPRADGQGWRMFYAAGSNACYGWQVFSAVSADGRTWTKEPGIRLSNGAGMYSDTRWPVGEGMVVDQLPNGQWRMIVGSFDQNAAPNDTWQVTEWRSPDQLQWTYVGTVLTTLQLPAGFQGSVYSPTIRQIAPGLWRMLFTADGRWQPGTRSAVWSAVSTDCEHWQVEGEVLGGTQSSLYYAALVNDQIVFIRQDNGGPLQLAIATVTMP